MPSHSIRSFQQHDSGRCVDFISASKIASELSCHWDGELQHITADKGEIVADRTVRQDMNLQQSSNVLSVFHLLLPHNWS